MADLPATEPTVTVASFTDHRAAEDAIERLVDEGLPVAHLAIVGRDLRTVERLSGRVTTLRAATHGLASGALVGALVGWLLAVIELGDPLLDGLLLAFYGLVLGAILGVIVGLLGHALTHGRRDFSTLPAMEAGRYEIVATDQVAERARELLT